MNKDLIKRALGIFLKVVLPSFILFCFFMFPVNDFGPLISQKISQATQNKVNVSFKDLDLNLIPKPGIELNTVTVATAQFSPLRMKSLAIAPSILSLITFKPGFTASGEGVFSGNLDVSYRAGGKNERGDTKQIIELSATNISIEDLLRFLNRGIKGQGSLQMSLDSEIDPAGQGSEASLRLNSRGLRMPANSISAGDLGAITIPPLQISTLVLEGELKNNVFRIQRGIIGGDGDTLHGTIDGSVSLRVMAGPNGLQVVPTAYDLNLRLRMQNAFLDAFALKPLLEGYRSSQTSSESVFNLGLSAPRFPAPPTIKKIQ